MAELALLTTTLRGHAGELITGIAYGLGSAYAAATAIIILRRNCGPLAHAYSGPVMRETATGVPGWFRPLYFLGAPARFVARKLFPGVSLGLGSILALSSLLLMTSGHFGCSDAWYRGYQVLTLRGRWITAENLATGVSQQISAWAGMAAYAAGLLAAVLGLVLLARATAPLARIVLSLAGLAVLFVIADGFALFFTVPESSSPLPIISLAYVAMGGLLLLAASRAASPPKSDIAGLRAAALFIPAILLSYGVLIMVATLHVWGYIAYFFGVQLVFWGALQIRRGLQR